MAAYIVFETVHTFGPSMDDQSKELWVQQQLSRGSWREFNSKKRGQKIN